MRTNVFINAFKQKINYDKIVDKKLFIRFFLLLTKYNLFNQDDPIFFFSSKACLFLIRSSKLKMWDGEK